MIMDETYLEGADYKETVQESVGYQNDPFEVIEI